MQLLLVEDDKSLIQLLTSALEAQNYEVVVEHRGDLGKSRAETETFDVIVLDVELPELDGITICQELRRQGNFTPIVLLTARSSQTDRILGLESGADDYILKPFDLGELLARIHVLVRREHRFFQIPSAKITSDDDIFTAQLSDIWDRTKETTFNRIQDLFDVLQTLEKGEISPDLCERSQRTCHKLAGSLGTFGFEEGSKIAQLLEKTFAEVENLKTCLDVARPLILELYQVVIATDVKLHSPALSQQTSNPLENAQENHSSLSIPIALSRSSSLANPSSTIISSELSTDQDVDQPTPPQTNPKIEQRSEQSAHNSSRITVLSRPTPQVLRERSLDSNFSKTEDYILLVDHDQEFAQTLAHDAGSWKLGIKIVQSVQATFEVLQDSFPKVLLLNAELFRKEEDWQTLRNFRSRFPLDISLIILSESEGLENRLKALDFNADVFLQKPVTSSQIFASVSRAMNFHAHQRVKIMVVDDDEQVTTLLTTLLKQTHFQVEVLNDPTLFGSALSRIQPDLLVLDVEMPTLNGLKICQMIRQDFQWSWLPILFLTGHDDLQTLQDAFAVGADDFISKPINANGFVNRIVNRWQRSQLYRNQMDTDLLTGIANRTGGSRSFSHLLQIAQQSSQPLCLAVLDLDHFKQVNDRYGHEEGDRVLREFGEYLKQHCRSGDVLARWGGEEFIIAMLGLNREGGVKRMNEIRKQWRLQTFTSMKGECFQVSFSGGVAQYPIDGLDFQVLYRTADAALYKAKMAGRNLVLPSL